METREWDTRAADAIKLSAWDERERERARVRENACGRAREHSWTKRLETKRPPLRVVTYLLCIVSIRWRLVGNTFRSDETVVSSFVVSFATIVPLLAYMVFGVHVRNGKRQLLVSSDRPSMSLEARVRAQNR